MILVLGGAHGWLVVVGFTAPPVNRKSVVVVELVERGRCGGRYDPW
jgi:hypothetical protein